MSVPRITRARAVLLGAAVVIVGAGFVPFDLLGISPFVFSRRDCQHEWLGYRAPGNPTNGWGYLGASLSTIQLISVAEATQNIPEFHDCQRLIDVTGKAYGTLSAVFAHQDLRNHLTTLGSSTSAGGAPIPISTAPTSIRGTQGTVPQVGQSTTSTTVPRTGTQAVVPAQGPNPGAAATVPQVGQSTTNTTVPRTGPQAIVPVQGPIPDAALTFVEILHYGPAYEPLGIQPGHSCLFLSNPTNLKAILVWVPNNHDCRGVFSYNRLRDEWQGRELFVTRIDSVANATPVFSIDEYPPVARWDRDSLNNRHYIGVMCGAAWCEVSASAQHTSSPDYSTRVELPAKRRVRQMKGWWDEQVLAIPGANGLVPSNVRATVVPDPELALYTGHLSSIPTGADSAATPIYGQWRLSAYILVHGNLPAYEASLNLKSTQAGQVNKLWLCFGTQDLCMSAVPAGQVPNCAGIVGGPPNSPDRWWAKMVAPDGSVRHSCIRWWHAPPQSVAGWAFFIPATARWRWLAGDEGVWEGCIHGCCEVT